MRLADWMSPLVAASFAAAVLLVGSSQPAAAECNPPGPDMSFRKAAPYAARIVVGRVVDAGPEATSEGVEGSTRFTLEVEKVLRGATASNIVVDHLETGGCYRWLTASPGDRIALALEVRRPDTTYAKNTAAWLSQTQVIANYETLSMAKVRKLARVRLPETSADADGAGRGPSAAVGSEALSASVQVDPRAAPPGQVVLLTGRACLAPDGSVRPAVSPKAFWLVDTRADPPWNSAHLSEPGDWYPFGPAQTEADGSISAEITVPNRRTGEYVFWWRCFGTGWHVSTGPTLVIKALPETDAATHSEGRGAVADPPALIVALAGLLGLLVGVDRSRRSRPA